MSNPELDAAIVAALNTERSAMYFYQRAALRMKNPRARALFEQLAADERGHAESFFEVYRGGELPDLMASLEGPAAGGEWLPEVEGLLDSSFTDLQAMQLAMIKELHLEQQLRQLAAGIDDPVVAGVYLANADSTHGHYLQLEQEYRRLSGQP